MESHSRSKASASYAVNDVVGCHGLLIPLETDNDVKKFLRAILKEFVEKVDVIDSGLTDDLIACHVINDADKESLDGSHVPTRRERARKLWTILTTIDHTVFVRKVIPPLCQKCSHIIPSRFWRQCDVTGPQRPNDVRGGCDEGCTRCDIERRVRAGDMADFMLTYGLMQLDTHKHMCNASRHGTDWARIFKLFKSASHDKITRHTPRLRDILERHSLQVPRDLCHVMRKGFPCTCKKRTTAAFLPRLGLSCLSRTSSCSSVCSSSPSLGDPSSAGSSDLSLQDVGMTMASNRNIHGKHNNSNAAALSAVSTGAGGFDSPLAMAVSHPNLLLQNTWNSSGESGMSLKRGCSLPDCLGESGRQGETGLLTEFRLSLPPVPAESWSPEESGIARESESQEEFVTTRGSCTQEESGIASEPRPSLPSSCQRAGRERRVADTRLEAGASAAHPPRESAGHCDDDSHQTAVKQLQTAVWIEEEEVTFRKADTVFSEDTRLKVLNDEETRLEMFDDEETQLKVLDGEETQLKVLDDEETQLNILDDEEETRLKVFNDEETRLEMFDDEETQLKVLDREETQLKVLDGEETRLNLLDDEEETRLKVDDKETRSNPLNKDDHADKFRLFCENYREISMCMWAKDAHTFLHCPRIFSVSLVARLLTFFLILFRLILISVCSCVVILLVVSVPYVHIISCYADVGLNIDFVKSRDSTMLGETKSNLTLYLSIL